MRLYDFLSKICKGLEFSVNYLIGLFYLFIPFLFFREIGIFCHFRGFVNFGYCFRNIQLGDYCSIGKGVFLNCTSNSHIGIGSYVGINDYTYISSVYGIDIGDYTRIGEFVSIRDNDHVFSDPDIPISKQGLSGKSIKIGRDVWIGRGVFIGKGVEIGEGAVIGANSVVTKTVPPFAVAVGSPAKVIKYRNRE